MQLLKRTECKLTLRVVMLQKSQIVTCYAVGITLCRTLSKRAERKQLLVMFQHQGTRKCGSYQGYLTCLSFHLWREIQGRYTQQEAGG